MSENDVPARIQLLTDAKASGDPTLVTWLSRLKTNINTIIRQLRSWANVHVQLDAPDYINNPHNQYWHKILDPAWSSLYFEDFDNPKVAVNGQAITNWTGKTIADWQLKSDAVSGEIIADSTVVPFDTGTYVISVNAFVEMPSNGGYIITMYKDGAPTLLRMPIIAQGNADTGTISFTGIGHTDNDVVLDLRLELSPALGTINIYTISWSMFRISPLGLGGLFEGVSDVANMPDPIPIPPGWAKHP